MEVADEPIVDREQDVISSSDLLGGASATDAEDAGGLGGGEGVGGVGGVGGVRLPSTAVPSSENIEVMSDLPT